MSDRDAALFADYIEKVRTLEAKVSVLSEAVFVPGMMRCAKCKFVLTRTNLYVNSGTTGPGDNKTEPCPNGCGPLWPLTWEQHAREAWERAEKLHDENATLRTAFAVADDQERHSLSLVAEQYLQCPHCKSRNVETTNPHALLKAKAYYCEECDAESLPI